MSWTDEKDPMHEPVWLVVLHSEDADGRKVLQELAQFNVTEVNPYSPVAFDILSRYVARHGDNVQIMIPVQHVVGIQCRRPAAPDRKNMWERYAESLENPTDRILRNRSNPV